MQLSSIRTWLYLVALLAGNLISLPMAHAQGEREAFFSAYKEGEALWAKGQLKAALVPYKKAAELVSGAFGEKAADTGAILQQLWSTPHGSGRLPRGRDLDGERAEGP